MTMADATPAHSAGITRSDIWFEDGNVIIQAEKTHFKVYRGGLAANSSIFKDMFSMPQPPSAGELDVEGCPVVHVSDTAEDIAIVLQALFLRGHVAAGEPLSIPAVVAFLRLGKKYDIELLHAEALKRLHCEYPSTLGEMDLDYPSPMIAQKPDTPTDLIIANLAREQSLLSVLPLALYRCCCSYSAIQLMVGISGDDAVTTVLSAGDLLACCVALSSLGSTQYATTLAWLNPYAIKFPTCTSPAHCDNIRKFALHNVFFPSISIVGLATWSDFRDDWLWAGSMCSSCDTIAEKLHDDGRVKFWEALPSIFGLPEWCELRKE